MQQESGWRKNLRIRNRKYVAHLVPDVRTEGGVLLLGYLTGEAPEDILQLRVKNLKI
jgi:hypothetical protein